MSRCIENSFRCFSMFDISVAQGSQTIVVYTAYRSFSIRHFNIIDVHFFFLCRFVCLSLCVRAFSVLIPLQCLARNPYPYVLCFITSFLSLFICSLWQLILLSHAFRFMLICWLWHAFHSIRNGKYETHTHIHTMLNNTTFTK